jgi:hypothetical protein
VPGSGWIRVTIAGNSKLGMGWLLLRDDLLLRLPALIARAPGDAAAYGHFRDSCRDMARTLGYTDIPPAVR